MPHRRRNDKDVAWKEVGKGGEGKGRCHSYVDLHSSDGSRQRLLDFILCANERINQRVKSSWNDATLILMLAPPSVGYGYGIYVRTWYPSRNALTNYPNGGGSALVNIVRLRRSMSNLCQKFAILWHIGGTLIPFSCPLPQLHSPTLDIIPGSVTHLFVPCFHKVNNLRVFDWHSIENYLSHCVNQGSASHITNQTSASDLNWHTISKYICVCMWPLSELTSCASEIQLRCQFVNLICLSLPVDFSTRSLALSLSFSLLKLQSLNFLTLMNGKDPVKINENTIPRNILIKDAESRRRAGSTLI